MNSWDLVTVRTVVTRIRKVSNALFLPILTTYILKKKSTLLKGMLSLEIPFICMLLGDSELIERGPMFRILIISQSGEQLQRSFLILEDLSCSALPRQSIVLIKTM